jgi:hypothetical protein
MAATVEQQVMICASRIRPGTGGAAPTRSPKPTAGIAIVSPNIAKRILRDASLVCPSDSGEKRKAAHAPSGAKLRLSTPNGARSGSNAEMRMRPGRLITRRRPKSKGLAAH